MIYTSLKLSIPHSSSTPALPTVAFHVDSSVMLYTFPCNDLLVPTQSPLSEEQRDMPSHSSYVSSQSCLATRSHSSLPTRLCPLVSSHSSLSTHFVPLISSHWSSPSGLRPLVYAHASLPTRLFKYAYTSIPTSLSLPAPRTPLPSLTALDGHFHLCPRQLSVRCQPAKQTSIIA
jgi:hypothetical protein